MTPERQIPIYSDHHRLDQLPGGPTGAIAAAERHWQDLKRRCGGVPARVDLDPIELGVAALPWVVLGVAVRPLPNLVVRYTLCGTGIATLLGRDVTHHSSDEIIRGSNRAAVLEPYEVTLREGAPSYWSTGVLHERAGWRPVYRAVWPMRDGDLPFFLNLTVPVQAESDPTSRDGLPANPS